jgi:hypothetical protein
MTELYVITTLFNPAGYQSKYKLYTWFRRHMAQSGARLITVELAFAGQKFIVTEPNNPHHIQLRSDHYLWYKENLINIALKRLPGGWTHAAWLDADIFFARPDWLEETEKKLALHPAVQMFSHCIDLGPAYEPLSISEGFVFKLRRDAGDPVKLGRHGQPGGAWAASRELLETMGGLIDWSILGSNDHYMAHAMIEAVDPNAAQMPGSNYVNMFLDWQNRFLRTVNGEIGYVETSMLHYWHGRRLDRGYETRWKILTEMGFDPKTDLSYTSDGLLELTDAKPALRDKIREYFISRREDNIVL